MIKVSLRSGVIKKILKREKDSQIRKTRELKKELKRKYILERKILTRENKSQNWLARKLGYSSSEISLVMNGYRNVSPKLRERIMKMFPGYTWDELFKMKEE